MYNFVEPRSECSCRKNCFCQQKKNTKKSFCRSQSKLPLQRYKKYIERDAEIKNKKRKINKILFWLLFCRKIK